MRPPCLGGLSERCHEEGKGRQTGKEKMHSILFIALRCVPEAAAAVPVGSWAQRFWKLRILSEAMEVRRKTSTKPNRITTTGPRIEYL